MSGTETIKTFDAGLKSGTTLQSGKYTILKTLGQGGFGITYLAEMRVGSGNMTIKIAIKEFFIKLEHFRGDNGCTVCCTNNELKKDEIERWKKKFKRETKVMKSVDDFRVVKIIDYFEENATAYYSMEYIEGCNLNEYVPINGLSEKDSLLLIEKVAQSLKVLHNKNILHLDLNPMNIMRRNDGSVVIIDFGLSKLYDEDLNLKSTSITIGAEFPGYAPLEQEDFDGTFTPTLDIYALGANLFKMLIGENPPISRKLVYNFSLLRKKMTAKGVSSDTIGIVEKAMQSNPTERYQSVDDFLQALPVETDLTEVTVYDNDIDDVTGQYDKTQRAENVAIDENGNRYSIESIDGCTLDDYIKQQRKISEIQAITYIKAVAKALKYLHKINMAHLDLNPRNIMRSKDGKLFLMKIGLSKQNDDNGNAVSATSVSISVFSKGYAPQEQYWKSFDGIFTPTLDIYALGAIFYKMLTGETPPESNIIWDFSSLRRKLSVHGISAYTIAVVEKAMQLDKKNRYQSVDAFIVALSKLEEENKKVEVVNILESLKNEKLSDETQRRVDTVPKKTVAEPKVIQFDATRRVEKKDTNPKQEVVKEVETVNEQPQKMFAHPFSFKGRIRRLEYNLSVLIVVAEALLGSYIAYHSDYDNIICIVSIVLCGMFIIPQGAKRCHDLGNSGWWQLTLIYILVMMFDYSDEGGNRYGECPKKHKEHTKHYDPYDVE